MGEYRRQATTRYKNHDFFRQDNEEAMAIRIKCALDALEDVRHWLDDGGMVAVSARGRRAAECRNLCEVPGIQRVMRVESEGASVTDSQTHGVQESPYSFHCRLSSC